ncbi:hypothetical protein COS54_00240 [Candidatus Shapirobacteria bacterium CG03_land_8_20_14_0_80_39_12]|uniref:DUF4258 domain-containing protein n=1 Tax=Candidatus Shapirobacteria bacterium CG03_land_8_20_14_0_80_39_12 TaxID=1974879 RepID=A0A2M7BFM4_9BACT|nr:MAG: hypothetical protein COS54_00240 [Candidatus Shapirobacteria bacterium CG03_land_8_20_14_0_80_39_12]
MGFKYGNAIWTDHALQRLKERGLKIEVALAAFNSPQESRPGNIPGSTVYYRTWENDRVEVVGKQNEKGEWIILSVWSRKVENSKWTGKLPWWKSLLKEILGK